MRPHSAADHGASESGKGGGCCSFAPVLLWIAYSKQCCDPRFPASNIVVRQPDRGNLAWFLVWTSCGWTSRMDLRRSLRSKLWSPS